MITANHLARTSWDCVHFIPIEQKDGLLPRLGTSEFAIFEMDAQTISTKEQLFAAIAKAMCFPDYFGMNWDALQECLRDMEWAKAGGYILFVNHAEALWKAAPRLAGSLVESWLFCAEEWAKDNVPFHLVFVW